MYPEGEGKRPAVLVANPIYPLGEPRNGAEWRFEVLSDDATALRTMIGGNKYFFCDGRSFWGRLLSLEPVDGTHAVTQLPGKHILLGVMAVTLDDSVAQQ
jgi:hypothetical protein